MILSDVCRGTEREMMMAHTHTFHQVPPSQLHPAQMVEQVRSGRGGCWEGQGREVAGMGRGSHPHTTQFQGRERRERVHSERGGKLDSAEIEKILNAKSSHDWAAKEASHVTPT